MTPVPSSPPLDPKRRSCPEVVTTLSPGSVFVFGSNINGFHGAGAAGVAQRGDSRNNWRQDEAFLKALATPLGHPSRIGRWAVLGVGKGYQEGREGVSYAIATVTRPGEKRSIPLREITSQLLELGGFAAREGNQSKTFLVTISGGGYNGYSHQEIAGVYCKWWEVAPPPSNVLVKKRYLPFL